MRVQVTLRNNGAVHCDSCLSSVLIRIYGDHPGGQTSHATQWALYLLARNPECQQRMLEEVDRVLGKYGGESVGQEHLPHMPYVKGVIKECLRLYPVAPFLSRVLDKEITLNGFRVPAGVSSPFVLHHSFL